MRSEERNEARKSTALNCGVNMVARKDLMLPPVTFLSVVDVTLELPPEWSFVAGAACYLPCASWPLAESLLAGS